MKRTGWRWTAAALGLIAMAGGVACAQEAPARPIGTVVLLGTGMPRPNPAASGPATAVVTGDRVFLVDAGPGVERQLAAAGLPINGVTAVFITHLHTDHTLGYPDLIFTSWVMGRHTPLQVYGPPGLQAMTDHLVAAYREDIAIRTEGLERESPGGYRVAVHEVLPGVVYDSAGVRVSAIAVQHGGWAHAYGYVFEIGGRRVVISGDTRPSETVVRAARHAEVLVHEVYSETHLKPEERSGGDLWPRYMRSFHTSDVELGELARRADPKVLVLTHLIRMGATDSELVAGVRKGGFGGRVIVGKDLDRIPF